MENYPLSMTGAEIDAALALAVEHETSKADADGTIPAGEALHAQNSDFAMQLETDREIDDADEACPPIVFGTVGGDAEVQSGLMKFEEVRGNTIKWNQLVQNGNFADNSGWDTYNSSLSISDNVATLTATAKGGLIQRTMSQVLGHKYLLVASIKLTTGTTSIRFTRAGASIGGSTENTASWQIMTLVYDGASTTNAYMGICDNRNDSWDAIQIKNFMLFDLTDIYGAGNEPSTYAEFACNFPIPYYAYNAGTLLSSKSASLISVGKNQCPGLDEYFRVIPGETYEVSGISAGGYLQEYDGNKTLIKTSSEITSATDITLDNKTAFCKLQATTYTIPFCYILWSTPNEAPEAYSATTVTLPNITLRSLGDVYDVTYQTGGGKRRIGERAYESGDENDPDVRTDGTTTIYVLETETDITTTENPGWEEYLSFDNFGTLEFTQDPAQDVPVPQAYFIRYTVNPVEFLDSLGESAGWDADQIALKSDIVVPNAPTTDGTYTLKVTVSGGTPTYSWVADS